ncbi:hypothetical protein L1887_42142 [Cichorium endivia]|nr:hypothetical protein L1887_42142 [Cichorium endivia]
MGKKLTRSQFKEIQDFGDFTSQGLLPQAESKAFAKMSTGSWFSIRLFYVKDLIYGARRVEVERLPPFSGYRKCQASTSPDLKKIKVLIDVDEDILEGMGPIDVKRKLVSLTQKATTLMLRGSKELKRNLQALKKQLETKLNQKYNLPNNKENDLSLKVNKLEAKEEELVKTIKRIVESKEQHIKEIEEI